MSILILELVPYVTAALSLAACASLFVLLKVEMRRRTLKSERACRALAEQCTLMQSSIDEMRQQIAEFPPGNREHLPPSAPRPSLNISHRAQALRLSRRGEGPGQIAAALGVPLAEVELLLKVYQATAEAHA